ERVVSLPPDGPGDRRDQIVLRRDRLRPGALEHEAAGAVRVLGQSWLGAELTEQGRLLVAGDSGDRGLAEAELVRDPAVDLTRPAHLREHRGRNAEQLEQVVVPPAGVDVEQHRSRGVARVGQVQPAAGQLPDEPGINGPERQLAGLRSRTRAGDVVEDPGELAAGKISVNDEASSVADEG